MTSVRPRRDADPPVPTAASTVPGSPPSWSADGPDPVGACRVRTVLVRHAESHWNLQGVVQGQRGPGLTEHGHARARAVAAALRRYAPEASAIVRSDLLRVAEMARPYEAMTGLPVTVDARLREIDTGAWTGKPYHRVAAEFPEEVGAILRGEDVRRGGGESFADVRTRVAQALDDAVTSALDAMPGMGTSTVVVFGHGGPIRVGVAAALGLPPGAHRLLEPPANSTLAVVDHISDFATGTRKARLVAYNLHPENVGAP